MLNNYVKITLQNLVDVETSVLELRLDHNRLTNLGGALMGLHGLLRLNLSNNQLQKITPDDFIGLEDLRLLDISHNNISTLEETSQVCYYVAGCSCSKFCK